MYQDYPRKTARRRLEKGQTGNDVEVTITEVAREATRRVGSPWGRRPRELQHFKGIEVRRVQRQHRGNDQRYPENQGKRGLPRKPRGGRWGCWNGWGVHWGQSSGSTKGGPEGKPGIFSRDQELHSVGGRTGKGQEPSSACGPGGTGGVGALVDAASRQVLGTDRSLGDRRGYSDI